MQTEKQVISQYCIVVQQWSVPIPVETPHIVRPRVEASRRQNPETTQKLFNDAVLRKMLLYNKVTNGEWGGGAILHMPRCSVQKRVRKEK